MTEALLPPDPSKDGWYWVQEKTQKPDLWCWTAKWQKWACPSIIITPHKAAQYGCRLASPHPIPGPEQLDALHALKEEIVQIGTKMTDSESAGTVLHGIVKRLGQRLSVVIEGKP